MILFGNTSQRVLVTRFVCILFLCFTVIVVVVYLISVIFTQLMQRLLVNRLAEVGIPLSVALKSPRLRRWMSLKHYASR